MFLGRSGSLLAVFVSHFDGCVDDFSHVGFASNVTTRLVTKPAKEHRQHAMAADRLLRALDMRQFRTVTNKVEGKRVVAGDENEVPRTGEAVVTDRAEIFVDPVVGFEANGHLGGNDADVVELGVLNDVADLELVLPAWNVEGVVRGDGHALLPSSKKAERVHGKCDGRTSGSCLRRDAAGVDLLLLLLMFLTMFAKNLLKSQILVRCRTYRSRGG